MPGYLPDSFRAVPEKESVCDLRCAIRHRNGCPFLGPRKRSAEGCKGLLWPCRPVQERTGHDSSYEESGVRRRREPGGGRLTTQPRHFGQAVIDQGCRELYVALRSLSLETQPSRRTTS